jgi:hypothetical protein
MNMTPNLRKFALTGHVGISVGLLGAIASFLAMAVAGLGSHDMQVVRAAYLAMDLLARFVIVPLALAALLTGLIEALCTPWGLVRHYWVLAKLVVTGFATIILLVKLELVSYAAHLATQAMPSETNLHFAGTQLVAHSAGGLLVLFVPLVLSIYKPRGMTPYGLRKQRERLPDEARLPLRGLWSLRRQVTAPLVAVTLVVLVFLILHLSNSLFGAHGQ